MYPKVHQYYQKPDFQLLENLKITYHFLPFQLSILKMPVMKKHQKIVENLLLIQVCIYLFIIIHVFCNLLHIIYVLVVENRSSELGIWLNDLNNNSLLCETISDVSFNNMLR